MSKLNKIGFLILCSVWIVGYPLKHMVHIVTQLTVDYFITFATCIGIALISMYYGKLSENRKEKHLFYGTITILNLSIVITYLIDLAFDSIFGTTKVIFVILTTSIISLCIYFCKVKF
jgi:hypothetical protein